MTEVLSKPADQIGIHDIKLLVEQAVPEGELIEFKERISSQGGLYDKFQDAEEFRTKARTHLTRIIQDWRKRALSIIYRRRGSWCLISFPPWRSLNGG